MDEVHKPNDSDKSTSHEAPRHFIPLQPYILLSTLFSNTLSLCSSLNVRDQVSHQYRTTDKIMVLYTSILILTVLDAGQEYKDLVLNVSKGYPNSVSSYCSHESNFDVLLSFPNI
jgi:hypothetical protein